MGGYFQTVANPQLKLQWFPQNRAHVKSIEQLILPNAYYEDIDHSHSEGGKTVSEQDVLYEAAKGVATITINRPSKYNALNTAVVSTLRDFFKQAEEDS